MKTTKTRSDTPQVYGMLETTVVVKRHTEVHGGQYGDMTIGQFIDNHLHECAVEGVEVQSVQFHIREEVWNSIRENAMATPTHDYA